MASDYGGPDGADRAFVILSQIFGAFAHGAGGLRVDGKVILQARADYDIVIRRYADEWAKYESAVLEAARNMGRLAAAKALNRDSIGIELVDYQSARRSIAGFGICPFAHH